MRPAGLFLKCTTNARGLKNSTTSLRTKRGALSPRVWDGPKFDARQPAIARLRLGLLAEMVEYRIRARYAVGKRRRRGYVREWTIHVG